MRTTLDIDEDVLLAAKAMARRQRRSAGSVISELARKGLTGNGVGKDETVGEDQSFYGFNPLPKRGVVVTDELIDALRDEYGD